MRASKFLHTSEDTPPDVPVPLELSEPRPLVSVIVPAYNEEKFLPECLDAILAQTYRPLEVSIHDDMSEDKTPQIIREWLSRFAEVGILVKASRNDRSKGRGCGFAKNRAIAQSTGDYLCFQDADDIMAPDRVELQLKVALLAPDAIVGSNFARIPAGATPRYEDWCNRLTAQQLMTQRFREVTIIQPTWFMKRDIFDRVGGYDETFPSCPEDMIFFYAHLGKGGTLRKVDKVLVQYRYHEGSTCKRIHRLTLMKIRVAAFEEQVLRHWPSFTIWGAGRDGRKFFSALQPENQKKVVAFCDVDVKKVGTNYINSAMPADLRRPVPVVHWTKAVSPLVTCVALDRTKNEFETNIASLNLTEGVDLFYFN